MDEESAKEQIPDSWRYPILYLACSDENKPLERKSFRLGNLYKLIFI